MSAVLVVVCSGGNEDTAGAGAIPSAVISVYSFLFGLQENYWLILFTSKYSCRSHLHA